MNGKEIGWRFLCLFICFGRCLSMQPGLEYHYRYAGHLATGITELRDQYAAAGIKMDVTVQVEEDYSFLIQFFDIQIGDFHDILDCEYFTSELPLTYSELENGQEFLETPFKIAMNAAQHTGTLEVPKNEPIWITNVKKAVIDVFPLATLWKEIQLGKGERFLRPNFGSEDELIGGRCMTWYSATKLPEDEAAKINKKRESRIEEDIQLSGLTAERLTSGKGTGGGAKGPGAGAKGPGAGAKGPAAGAKGPAAGAKGPAAGSKGQKTSQGGGGVPVAEYTAGVPPISDSLWKVVRTIDYDMCEDKLVSLKINAPSSAQKLISRSSTARYLIRGDQRGIRVEKGVVEGSISLFVSKDEDDRIDTFTNQTVELKAVRRISRKILINYEVKRFRHWYFEFDHLTRERTDGRHLTVEETLTGIDLQESTLLQLKQAILTQLADLDEDSRYAADTRRDLAEAITYLSYSHIKSIYEQLESAIDTGSEDDKTDAKNKLYNFHISLVISGSEPALNYLIDKVSEEDFLRNTKGKGFLSDGVISLYEIGLRTIKNPRVISRMLEFAMTMSWETYGSSTKAITLTTAATMAHKLCFSAERRQIYSDTTCRPEHVCDSAEVANSFLPYLQEKLRERANNVTMRVVYIQALVNLGLPKSVEILAPIIMGTTETDIGIRKIAIMGLSSHIMHVSTLSVVFDLLMPITENKGEHPDIRGVAFLSLASWNPGLTWWKHMAYFTWHESSLQVASLVSSTMQVFASEGHDLHDTVSKVIHLVKPTAPALTSSSVIWMHPLTHSSDLGIENELLWIASAEGLLPTHLSIRILSRSLYGFPEMTKYLIHQQGLSKVITLFVESVLRKPSAAKQDQTIVEEMIKESLEQLGLQRNVSTKWQYWQSIGDVLLNRGQAGELTSLAQELSAGPTQEYTGHDIWVDSTIALPTDLGLPIIIKHTEDSSVSNDFSEFEADAPSLSHMQQKIGLDFHLGSSYSTSIRVKTLVPWSRRTTAVGTGIHSFLDLVLPIAFQFGGRTDYKDQPKGILEVIIRIQSSLEEQTQQKQMIHVENRPYTIRYGTFPTRRLSPDNEDKTVKRYDSESHNTEGQLFQGIGLHLDYTWKSCDVPVPDASQLFWYPVQEAVPGLYTWEYKVFYDPSQSIVSNIDLIFEVVSIKSYRGSSGSDDLTQFGQQSQGQEDFDDFSQFSQSASQDYSQFSQSASNDYSDFSQQSQGADLQVSPDGYHSCFDDLSILSQFSYGSAGRGAEFGPIYGIGLSAVLEGTQTTTHRFRFFVSSGKNTREQRTALAMMVAMDTDEQEMALVTNWHFNSPLFLPFMSTEEVLNSNLQMDVEGKVDLRVSGAESVAHVKINMEPTENKITEIREHFEKHCAYGDVDPALEIFTYSIYDHAKITASWDRILHIFLNQSGVISAINSNCQVDDTAGEDGHELQIEVTQDLSTNIWTLRSETPREAAVAESASFVSVMFPGLFSLDTFEYELINNRRSPYCTIKDEGVRTFDSLEYPAVPSNCWKVAAYDCFSGRAMFQVRKADQWEVRVLWRDEGLAFDISNSDILVNSDSPDEEDERYKVLRFDDALMVIFSTRAAVKVSDKVEIYSPPEVRSLPCGLCGNYDGDKASEMIGPKGCVYTDTDLFSHAWSVAGDGCNAFSLRGHKQKVDRYQQNCPKRATIPTGVSHGAALSQCTSWQFINKVEGSWNCTAIIRTPKCKKGCVSQYAYQSPIPFDCYLTDARQTDEVNECYPRTMFGTIPKGCRKQ